MYYIPYYLDASVQSAILWACAAAGVVAVLRGRRGALPPSRLRRRAAIAAGAAFAGILLYNVYILKRQAVESANHMTFGEARQARPAPPQ